MQYTSEIVMENIILQIESKIDLKYQTIIEDVKIYQKLTTYFDLLYLKKFIYLRTVISPFLTFVFRNFQLNY